MNYVVAKTAPGIISPHVLAMGRWFLAGLILAFIARSELWQERQSTLNAWKQYVVLGCLGMLICGAWVYWAAETTTAINIALIYAASPVLITLGAVIGLKESFSWRQSLGGCQCFAGRIARGCQRPVGSTVTSRLGLR